MKVPQLDAEAFAFLLWKAERGEPIAFAEMMGVKRYVSDCAKERYQLLNALASGYLVHQQKITEKDERIAELEQALREARERISA